MFKKSLKNSASCFGTDPQTVISNTELLRDRFDLLNYTALRNSEWSETCFI